MKKTIVIALLLLPALLCAKPVIKFKNLAFDFGEADAGTVLDILFNFENAGGDILSIKNIVPACGCTTAELKKKDYQPGEKGVIATKFYTSGYSGRVIKTITVTSNDPDSPEVRLTISGTVALKDFAQADLKPDHIVFGTVSAGKTYERKLSLSNQGTIGLRVLEISHGPETVLEFKTNTLAAKESTEIVLRFTPFDKGTFNTIVKIRTNDTRNPYAFVRLESQVD
jgi:hypothetical protein